MSEPSDDNDTITMQEILDHAMAVEACYPPNIDLIAKVLPGARGLGVVFTYGDVVYNPSGNKLPVEILTHEATHACQQMRIGKDEWWTEYLKNPAFRYHQELQAHKAEYLMYAATHNRHLSRVMLKAIGQKLASQLYGKLNKTRECMNAIKEGL